MLEAVKLGVTDDAEPYTLETVIIPAAEIPPVTIAFVKVKNNSSSSGSFSLVSIITVCIDSVAASYSKIPSLVSPVTKKYILLDSGSA